LYATNVIRVTF